MIASFPLGISGGMKALDIRIETAKFGMLVELVCVMDDLI